MKLMKNAFTLAEVLVVLAILGVVAALTMPTLHMDANKATVGPSLAKAISTLENANELLLVDTNARSIADVADDKYLDTLVRRGYLKLVSGSANLTYNLFPNGGNGQKPTLDTYYAGSDNIAYFQDGILTKYNEETPCPKRQGSLPSEFNGACYQIYVDINTPNKGPNALGKDLFRLFVDGKGSVIPDGGEKAKTYFDGVNAACNRDRVTDGGYSCAGSIVDNGYKVIYPY